MQTPSYTPATYFVRSSRDPNCFYTVAENARGFLESDCPAATFYRTKPCKHAEQVRRGCELRAIPKARPDYRITLTPQAAALSSALEV